MRRWRASARWQDRPVYIPRANQFLRQPCFTLSRRASLEKIEVMSRVRGWLNCENVRQSTFRYWLSEPDSVLRVNFEFEDQAQAFAQAFGGVVLGLSADSRPRAPRH